MPRLEPSSDLYLVIDGSGPSQISVAVRDDDGQLTSRPITWPSVPGISFPPNGSPTGVCALASGATRRTTVARLTLGAQPGAAGGPDHFLVRINVRRSVIEIVPALRHLTLDRWDPEPGDPALDPDPARKYLPVFARFDDGSLGDVSLIPGFFRVVETTPSPASPVEIQTLAPSGGLFASAPTGWLWARPGATGAVDVRVSRFASLAPFSLVTIEVPSVTAFTPEVRLLHPLGAVQGQVSDRANFLLLAEGFSDRQFFWDTAHRVVQEMIEREWNQPISRLRDDINIWGAFVQSHDEGIGVANVLWPDVGGGTAGMKGVDVPGFVGSDAAAADALARMLTDHPDDWFALDPGHQAVALAGTPGASGATATLLRGLVDALRRSGHCAARDTRLGLSFSVTASSPVLRQSRGAGPSAGDLMLEWLAPRTVDRAIQPDARRHREWTASVDRCLAMLRYAGLPQLGALWRAAATSGDDRRVGFLVYDEQRGGFFSPLLGNRMALSIGRLPYTRTTSVPNPGIPESSLLSIAPVAPPPMTHFQGPVETASRVVHEFAHAHGCGDEYDYGGAPVSGMFVAPRDESRNISGFGNVEHSSDITLEGARSSLARVKWNWHRIGAASEIVAAVSPPSGAAAAVGLRVSALDAQHWLTAQTADASMRVYIRAHLGPRGDVPTFGGVIGPFTVQLSPPGPPDASGNVTLSVLPAAGGGSLAQWTDAVGPGGQLPRRSILYSPLRDGSAERTLIPQPVAAYLAAAWAGVQPRVDRRVPVTLRSVLPGSIATSSPVATPPPVLPADARCATPGSAIDEAPFVPASPPPGVTSSLLAAYSAHITGAALSAGRVVGIYEGAMYYSCGVYRPAGACKMRVEASDSGLYASPFCLVCKYIFIGAIRPLRLVGLS